MSNLAVDQRFANGTQGRLMHWNPGATESARFALPASHPELLARFVKESSLEKPEMLPEIDHLDIWGAAREAGRARRAHPAPIVRGAVTKSTPSPKSNETLTKLTQ